MRALKKEGSKISFEVVSPNPSTNPFPQILESWDRTKEQNLMKTRTNLPPFRLCGLPLFTGDFKIPLYCTLLSVFHVSSTNTNLHKEYAWQKEGRRLAFQVAGV